jgi:hypothetical protein
MRLIIGVYEHATENEQEGASETDTPFMKQTKNRREFPEYAVLLIGHTASSG